MAKAIIGGLLSGAGKGLVARGQNQREEAAAMREEALERARERRKREFTRERDEARREHQSGLLSRTVPDEQGRLMGVTRGGDPKDTGIRVGTGEDGSEAGGANRGSGSGSDGGGLLMSTEDKRLWDAAIQRHTTESIDGKKTDWAAVEAELRQAGREGLAQLAAESEATAGRIDVESPEWRKAEEQARAEAESRNPVGPDFIRPGGMKEAYGDLSEEEWVNRRTREIYEGLTGRGRAAGGGGQRQRGGQDRGGDRGTGTGGGSGRGAQAQVGQRADAQPLPTKNGKIDASKLAEGQIYDTPRGLARYLGNGEFESVD